MPHPVRLSFVYPTDRIGSNNVVACIINVVNPPLHFWGFFYQNYQFSYQNCYSDINSPNVTEGKLPLDCPLT